MTVSDARPATDITVNLDGLWLLQALLGIARLAPELHGRPYGEPRAAQDWVTQHPELSVLVEQGICDEAGVVRTDITERMAVLAAPDVEVSIMVSQGPLSWATQVSIDDPSTWRAIPDDQLRIVLARRDGRWASGVRAGAHITIDDCPPADAEWLARLVCDGLDSIHQTPPSRMSPVNVPMQEMRDIAEQRTTSGGGLNRDAPLRSLGLKGLALTEVAAALDDPLAEAVLYARAYVDATTVLSESTLSLRDTESGRVALFRMSPVRGSRQEWMAIGPATPAQVRHAVTTVLGSVAVSSWENHERMSS